MSVRKLFQYCLYFSVAISTTATSASEIMVNREAMKANLSFIENIYKTSYAPLQWKQELIDWNLEQEIALAKAAVDSKAQMSLTDYQNILRDFFRSTQDYHVNYAFDSTERAKVPFTILSAEGRYFIVFIDRTKLSAQAFPFQEGDEVLQIDGQPIQQVVGEIKSETSQGVDATDSALAELFLTNRARIRGQTVPLDTRVEFLFATKSSEYKKQVSFQMAWEYTPEKVKLPVVPESSTELLSPMAFGFPEPSKVLDKLAKLQMVGGPIEFLQPKEKRMDGTQPAPNPFYPGVKKSFLPDMGLKIWETDSENKFYAYIYKNENRQLVGYVRIPSYGAGEAESKAFAEIIKKFEPITDALVIDQVNNPGGSVFYLYSLVAMLTDTTIANPRHRMKITTQDVYDVYDTLKELSEVKNDEQAQAVLGKSFGGYPVSYQTVEYIRNYCHFILKEWEAGRTLTRPYYIYGADKINPSSEVNYTKPILVLVNSLDFSGGDFFPAILQDNKRATIFGTRTAGAGGYVNSIEYPNNFGLKYFSWTGSIAQRVNDQPIENLGVTPDIQYDLTVKDLTSNFEEYKNAVNSAVSDMIESE